jgi:acyl transferase domain-containing protein
MRFLPSYTNSSFLTLTRYLYVSPQEVDKFDAAAFGIPSAEAALVDPRQRLVLESAIEALLSAPLPTGNAQKACGVFVGCSSNDYLVLASHAIGVSPFTGTGIANSVISGRVSYSLGLRGPALSVDTACSASLVAVHMAVNSMVLGQCDAAMGSGVNLMLHPETSDILQKAGMLTADGRCKALSATADGYVRAEACGTLLLRSGNINAAECLALVPGSSVNQDGTSSSLTAPNGPAQQEVIRAALRASSLGAGSLAALQMHGTGTALGDPIEVGAAAAVLLDEPGGRPAPLALMAAKSRMGHAEAGAGVAGLVHSAVALAHRLNLPLLHLGHLNPYCTAIMDKRPERWSVPRQSFGSSTMDVVGTSAFAFQGTNAHVMLQSLASVAEGARPVASGFAKTAVFARERHWVAPAHHR